MRGSDYAELVAFVAVAEQGSFARAAQQLRVAPSTLSQTIRKLEARLGVELLHRTTRRVSTTGAGARLLERFRPAMDEMAAAVVDVRDLRGTPAGPVRLHLPPPAYASLLDGALGTFHRTYPAIVLEVVVDDAVIDLVAAGFDLDVRRTGLADPSLHAVPVGGPVRHVVVAAPAYLAAHGCPTVPSDLRTHPCIQWRRPGTAHPARWTFEIDGEVTVVNVDGPLTVSHCALAVAAALEGVSIAFVLDQHARPFLEQGSLEGLLTEYLPVLPGWSVCSPRRSRMPTAVRAMIAFLAARGAHPA